MHTYEYSKHLGLLSSDQFQMALNRFGLGKFLHAEPIPFGLFGQNVFVTSTDALGRELGTSRLGKSIYFLLQASALIKVLFVIYNCNIPILSLPASVNQNVLFAPAIIPKGKLLGVGMG
jgi:hypothetical protein